VPQLVVERCNCGLILMEYTVFSPKKKMDFVDVK